MKSDARQTLADFLIREIGAEKDAGGSERSWAAKHRLPPHDVRRARKGATGMSLDKLQNFAEQLGVEAWQLLFPGFERDAEAFPTMSAEAIDLARQLDALDDGARMRAYAAIVGVLRMVTEPPSAPASPGGPTEPSPGTTRAPAKSR